MRRITKWLLPALTALCLLALGAYVFHDRLVRDNDAPTISFASEPLSLSVYAQREELLSGVSAWDDRDGDVSASLLVEGISSIHEGDWATVTYAAFDRAGNVAKAERAVLYTDYEGPRFSLSGALVFRSGTSTDLFRYVTASDPLDGDISDRVKATLTSDSSSLSEVGLHQVELRVTNSMGDTARLTVPVEVCSSSAYNATAELSDYLIYVKTGSAFSPEDYLIGLSISGRDYPLSQLNEEGAEIAVQSGVRTDAPGVYDVTYTISYRGYTGYTRLIVVVEE